MPPVFASKTHVDWSSLGRAHDPSQTQKCKVRPRFRGRTRQHRRSIRHWHILNGANEIRRGSRSAASMETGRRTYALPGHWSSQGGNRNERTPAITNVNSGRPTFPDCREVAGHLRRLRVAAGHALYPSRQHLQLVEIQHCGSVPNALGSILGADKRRDRAR